MKGSKTIFIILLGIVMVTIIQSSNALADVDNKPTLRGEQIGKGVYLEWAVEMLDEDIIYETGFEEGDVLPNLNYSSSEAYLPENRWYGGQSFTTEDSYEGSRSLKIVDTYKNGNVYSTELDGTVYVENNYAWSDFKKNRYYVENGTDLSLSYRAKTRGKGDVRFKGVGGFADYGTPLRSTFLEDVKTGDTVVKVSEPSFFKGYVDAGKRIHLANQKGRYSNVYVTEVDMDKSEITLHAPFRGEFKKGDNVLRHYNRHPVDFGMRSVKKEDGWVLNNLNTKVKDFEDYNTKDRGFYLTINTTTHDAVYIDDIKVGHATQTELYRDNEKIYEGKLSEFEDVEATDKEKPDKVIDYNVTKEGNKQVLSVIEPKDNGTEYEYRIDAISNDGRGTYSSETEKVEVTSGIKGYSYVIDKNKNTKPSGKINLTAGKIELDNGVYKEHYLHIQAIDNAGNVSEVSHIKLDKVEDIMPPTVKLSQTPTDWTNGNVTINVDAEDDRSGIKEIYVEGENTIKNGGKWETYNGKFDVTEEGKTRIESRTVDKAGNKSSVTTKEVKLDKTGADIELTKSKESWTNKNVTIKVDATDKYSGVKKIMYIGDNMVKDSTFQEGDKYWTAQQGNVEFRKGSVLLGDDRERRNKMPQNNAFKGDVAGTTYYAEVEARGKGVLNVRYGVSSSIGVSGQEDYKQDMKSSKEYMTYRFLMVRKDYNNKQLMVEKIGKVGDGSWIEIKEVKVFAEKDITDTRELEVSENGSYMFVVEDNVGNFTTETVKVDNIDKEGPTVDIIPSTKEKTHENVILTVDAEDKGSGVKNTTYIGENMIRNGDFSEGDMYWNTVNIGGGKVEFDKAKAIFRDNKVERNKMEQRNAFDGTAKGVEYVGELQARGSGEINMRYGIVGGVGGSFQNDYQQDIKDENNFKSHYFKFDRREYSTEHLMIERVGNGYMEVSDVKVYEQKDITERGELEVTQNGVYTFVVEDNAGNITTETYTVDNIDKTISFDKPTVGKFGDITIGEQVKVASTDISPLTVKDWRDDNNDWEMKVTASALTNGKHTLPNGTMKLKPVSSIERVQGSGEIPVKGFSDEKAIDSGSVKLIEGKESRGEYEIVFQEGALEIEVDPTKVKRGTYESTMRWELVQAP